MARLPLVPARRGAREAPGPLERFYQHLLQLELHPDALLGDALRLVVEATCASTAYVELFANAGRPAVVLAHDVAGRTHEAIGATIERDVVARVVAEHRTLAFESRGGSGVVTMLCVPIRPENIMGFVWLEGERQFSELDRERVRLLARRLAIASTTRSQRSLLEEQRALSERRVLEELKRHNGNVSKAARVLDVSRAFIYSVLKRRRSA
jgi:transcriptional regulator with GAF, ATPase, and Fis domain